MIRGDGNQSIQMIWVGLNCIGLNWSESTRMELNSIKQMDWNGMERKETEWNEMEMEWSRMEWNEIGLNWNWIELKWTELNWTEPSWIEFKWSELHWIELNWIEVNWIDLNWTELNWIELLCVIRVATMWSTWHAELSADTNDTKLIIIEVDVLNVFMSACTGFTFGYLTFFVDQQNFHPFCKCESRDAVVALPRVQHFS